jgi:hypothetical protein
MTDRLPNLLYHLVITPMALLRTRFGFQREPADISELHDDEKTYNLEDFEKPW